MALLKFRKGNGSDKNTMNLIEAGDFYIVKVEGKNIIKGDVVFRSKQTITPENIHNNNGKFYSFGIENFLEGNQSYTFIIKHTIGTLEGSKYIIENVKKAPTANSMFFAKIYNAVAPKNLGEDIGELKFRNIIIELNKWNVQSDRIHEGFRLWFGTTPLYDTIELTIVKEL